MSKKLIKVKTSISPEKKQKIALVLLIIICSLSAGFVGGYYGLQSYNQDSKNDSRTVKNISNEGNLIANLAKEVGPSVVSVNVSTKSVVNGFFGPSQVAQQSAGTGVIISADGVIITNRHVVPKGTTKVSITLSDGTQLDDVSVVGRTNDSDSLDVAFLKINDKKNKKLTPAKLGDSSSVQVGDRVIAIGNALGEFQNTVTSGIISGYGRDVTAGGDGSNENLQNLFQTDAAINQGNSGGPLVNMQGEVIAINTAIAGGDAQNIGFAIPISDLQGVINGVLKNGKLERPYLGVRYLMLNSQYAYEYNISEDSGAYIAPSQRENTIVPGSPAEKAGLKEKDIIKKVNNTKLDQNNSLSSVIGRFSVGDKVNLTVIRDDKTIRLEAILEAIPKD